MACENCDNGSGVLSTIVITITGILMVYYTFWSAGRKADQKSITMIKVKKISKELDDIEIQLSCKLIYRFVKNKINAAIEAMDNDDSDRASEYFVDALHLIAPNQKVTNLMKSNLPKNIILKIKEKYANCLD